MKKTKQAIAEGFLVFAIIVVACLIAVGASGCGHNAINYVNGDMTDIGITATPEGIPVLGLKRVSGENMTMVVKDNTLVNVSLTNGASVGDSQNGTGKTNRVSGILMYTGDQTTGYDVDVVEAIAKYDVQAAKAVAAKKNAIYIEGKVKEDGTFVTTEMKLGEGIQTKEK